MKHVTRYVVTMPWAAGGKGWRQLAHPAQGRHTFETAAEAHAWIDAARRNTSADTLRAVYGGADKLAVCACVCWANHRDPVGVYFPPGSEVAPDEAEAETIDAAHGVTIAPVPASECGAGSTEWDVFREGEHVSSHETRDEAAEAAQNLADDLNAADEKGGAS